MRNFFCSFWSGAMRTKLMSFLVFSKQVSATSALSVNMSVWLLITDCQIFLSEMNYFQCCRFQFPFVNCALYGSKKKTEGRKAMLLSTYMVVMSTQSPAYTADTMTHSVQQITQVHWIIPLLLSDLLCVQMHIVVVVFFKSPTGPTGVSGLIDDGNWW